MKHYFYLSLTGLLLLSCLFFSKHVSANNSPTPNSVVVIASENADVVSPNLIPLIEPNVVSIGADEKVKKQKNSKETVTDIDGNQYPTIFIGNQEWFAKNLMVTHYSNGDPIPTNLISADWGATTQGAFTIYPHSQVDGINSNEEMVGAYGLLYNWYSAADSRNVCPTGWRVPLDEDFATLVNNIINSKASFSGNQLKSKYQVNSPLGGEFATLVHPRWDESPSHYGTDDFGFNGLPSGYTFADGNSNWIGKYAWWWTASEGNNYGFTRGLYFDTPYFDAIGFSKNYGLSIRCIKGDAPPPKYTVTFQVYAGEGSLTANVDGYPYYSGGQVTEGKSIFFNATPNLGYIIKEWKVNGIPVEGNKTNYFNYIDIRENIDVTVEFEYYSEPEIYPHYQTFGLNDPTDMVFNYYLGSESAITQVICYHNNAVKGEGRYLIPGEEYFLTESTLTISSSFIFSLEPEINSWIGFDVVFGSGHTKWIEINVVSSTLPYLVVDHLEYDLNNPTDIFTPVVFANNSYIDTIYYNSEFLDPVNYYVNNGWLFLTSSFLSSVLTEPAQQIDLIVQFNTRHQAPLTVTSIQSSYTNAIVTPSTIDYLNVVPEYEDFTITWNSATTVTNINLEVTGVNGSELYENLAFEVSDQGDGTAALRVFYPTAGSKSSKGETNNNISATLIVLFDQGAPANVFINITYEYFNVYVGIQPDYTGWVNGSGMYTYGKEVVLTANPNYQNTFVEWRNSEGVLVSTENPYIFSMPAEDVYLTAVFNEPQKFNVTYEVIGSGHIMATVDGQYIYNGYQVNAGRDINFQASPYPDNIIKEWKVNGVVVEGNTYPSFTYLNIQEDIHVTVEYQYLGNPYFNYYNIAYSVSAPEDVNIEVIWGRENEISKIIYTYWDEDYTKGSYEVELLAGTDYWINGNMLTLSSNWIQSQNPIEFKMMSFRAIFGSGYQQGFDINVLPLVVPYFVNNYLTFDISNPTDAFTPIVFASADYIWEVKNTYTGMLLNYYDYNYQGSWFTISSQYLNSQELTPGVQLQFIVKFNTGHEIPLFVNVVETGITNATLDPPALSYTNNFPEFQDFTLTLNSATNIANIDLTITNKWGAEVFDNLGYELVDNGDGIMALRVYFPTNNAAKGSAKDYSESFYNATLEVSFDQGSSFIIPITLVKHYFYVSAYVTPEWTGWVDNYGYYSVGDQVTLKATPYPGYKFIEWRDEFGAVLSTQPEYTFVMPEQDVNLYPVFGEAQMFNLSYEVINWQGYLNAYINGYYVRPNSQVQEGSNIEFYAEYSPEYKMKEWRVNGNLVEGNNSNYFTYFNIQEDIHVTVELEYVGSPKIEPNHQMFSLSEPSNLNFQILWGGETVINKLIYYYWDSNNQYIETVLAQGTDYFVNENILTIPSSWILSQNPENFSWYNFRVQFGSELEAWFEINVVPTTHPYLLNDNLDYDLSNPSDVFTTIIYSNAQYINEVNYQGVPLNYEQYTVDGNWLFISKYFISSVLTEPGQYLTLDVVFNSEHIAPMTINAIESGLTNATIDPSSITFVNHPPDYHDFAIVWNSATAVTKVEVFVAHQWGVEYMDWQNYEITDNGDGTANLRILFNEPVEPTKTGSKYENESEKTTIQVSFDQGAAANIYMTINYEFFNVYVDIVPEYTGSIEGNFYYIPGEEVWIKANPHYGYTFAKWTDPYGNLISLENPYIFSMPNGNVELIAVFEQAQLYTIIFDVVNSLGNLKAYLNGNPIQYGEQVPAGSVVEFYANSEMGLPVKQWTINGNVLPGYTQNYLHIDNINDNIYVTVEFGYPETPEIQPHKQLFSLASPDNVNFNIFYGNESYLSKVIYSYWDEIYHYQHEVELLKGVDYFVYDNVLSISSSWILSQNPEPFSYLNFTAIFGSGYTNWFEINVVPTTSTELVPNHLTYDLTNPADLYTTIVYANADYVTNISYNGVPLVWENDFYIEKTRLFIRNSLLSSLNLLPNNQISFEINFNNGITTPLVVDVIESNLINASVNPSTISYTNFLPEFQDFTITWNGAESVTGMGVQIANRWGVEQYEVKPEEYTITNNGDGTANLRLYFNDSAKGKVNPSKSEQEEHITITIRVDFNVGAPANIFMNLIFEYYNTIVDIVPENGGWVEGNFRQSPGKGVEMFAKPHFGYKFLEWRDEAGSTISTANPYYFQMPAMDVKLSAVFVEAQLYTVTYAVVNETGGYINATYNGYYFQSGGQVSEGTSIEFHANPLPGYSVKAWIVNGQIIEGYSQYHLYLPWINEDTHVIVEFIQYQNPDISPKDQYFGLMNPANVDFNIFWGSETNIERIKCNYAFDQNNSFQVELTQGIDFFINENTLTISKDFILGLGIQNRAWLNFNVEFSDISNSWFTIQVVPSTLPYLAPNSLAYDLSNRGDVFTMISFANAKYVENVTFNGMPLGTSDYRVQDAWLYINNSFLTNVLPSVGSKIELNVIFETGYQDTLKINAIASGLTNATVSPSAIEFINVTPEYQDFTITWNDATTVTKVEVSVAQDWGVEHFDWPMYEVTNHGDGTATLRVFFPDDNEGGNDKLGSKESEVERTSVNINVFFDKGGPASIFLTMISEHYDVLVTVTPENSGRVDGAWDYTPGRQVKLEAYPEFGFGFVEWRNTEGAVVSTENPYIFTMPSNTVELIAVFEVAEYKQVYYSTIGYNGYIDAEVDGRWFNSGNFVQVGKNIEFTAKPNGGFGVKEWRVNGEVVSGNISRNFVYENIQSDINVTVEFKPFVNPSIDPDVQIYILSQSNNPNFNVIWGDETSISKLFYFYWDPADNYKYKEFPLIAGTDYQISENSLILSASYLQTLNPKPNNRFEFKVEFGSGYVTEIEVWTVLSLTPHLIPSTLTYDQSNPSDAFTAIAYMSANEVVSINQGAYQLFKEVDYKIQGPWLIIKNNFLAGTLTEPGQQISLNVKFNTNESILLTIECIKSNIVNATITPTSLSYQNDMPYYQDLTITWNDASQVTGMTVLVDEGEGLQIFEYPQYLVTNNGDGTAKLRVFFGSKSNANQLSNSKGEEVTNIVIQVHFNVGASTNIFLNVIHTYYNVFVTVVPDESAGTVSGADSYTVGEDVWLEAYPKPGYKFQNWRRNGVVINNNPSMNFTMPANDIFLTAHFIPDVAYTYALNLVSYPQNGGEVYGFGQFMAGEMVTINAKPKFGYRFESWQNSQGTVLSNDPMYTLNMPTSSITLIANFVSAIEPQTISLTAGWNIFSTYVIPANTNMLSILQPLITNGMLVKVQDQEGKAVELINDQWINDIGIISPSFGYKIKVKSNTTLTITGIPIDGPTEMHFIKGWNISGYPAKFAQNAREAVNPIILAGAFQKMQSQTGASVENLPGIGWINNIGNMIPGQGYKLRVSADYTVNPSDYTNSKQFTPITSSVFVSNWEGMGYDHQNIYITNSTLNGETIPIGTQIGVFDGDLCVGIAIVGEKSNLIRLFATHDDPYTSVKDGFKAGNAISIKVWDNVSQAFASIVEVTSTKGKAIIFEPSGSLVIEVNAVTKTTDVNTITDASGLGRIYPNPLSTSTTIGFYLSKQENVRINVYNLLGQKVTTIMNQTLERGEYQAEWNPSKENLPYGVYIIRMELSGVNQAKRVIYTR